MLPNPKTKTFMTCNLYSFIYVENNSVLLNLNLHYLEMFIMIRFQFFLINFFFYKYKLFLKFTTWEDFLCNILTEDHISFLGKFSHKRLHKPHKTTSRVYIYKGADYNFISFFRLLLHLLNLSYNFAFKIKF